MTNRRRRPSFSALLRGAAYCGFTALLVGLAVVAPDSTDVRWRVGLLCLCGVLLLVSVGLALTHRTRVRRRSAETGSSLLPTWTAALPGRQYDELVTLVRTLNQRAHLAEQQAQQARKRAGQSMEGMWQVVASAVTSEEKARGRFVADLHDSVVQSVIVCTYLVEDTEIDRETIAQHLRETEMQLRDIMVLTKPPELSRGTLGSSVMTLCHSLETRRGLQVSWVWPEDDVELPEAVALTLYRFFQESLNNVAKHAGVNSAVAGLRVGAQIEAWVRDSGKGFDTSASVVSVTGRHVGLDLMEDRALQIGAHIDIRSAVGDGTLVRLTMPRPSYGTGRIVDVGVVDAHLTLPSADESSLRFGPRPAADSTATSAQVEVAVLDQDGVIISVNDAWENFTQTNGRTGVEAGVGASYLAICDAADNAEARQMAAAVRSALEGELEAAVTIRVPCDSPAQPDRFYDVLISTRLCAAGNPVGAVVTLSAGEASPAESSPYVAPAPYVAALPAPHRLGTDRRSA